MIKRLEKGGRVESLSDVYYVESEAELANIPAEAPPLTVALISLETGLVIKIKHSDGTWARL